MPTIKDLIAKYEEARTKKEEMEEALKAAKKELADVETLLSDQMLEEDTPSITVGSFTYSFKNETKYSFKSAETLAEMGVDKFDVLRENGYGFLIKEQVDARTLSATMKEASESDAGIPDEVIDILSVFEAQGVGRRKATAKQMAKAKASKEE